ncbi:MAG: J domain-containing protein [Cryobacterium sp.]
MHDSPAASTPYEVLGVSPTVDADELRKAYRRLLRQTHPDVGGSAAQFHAVQIAWERIGTPENRAAYDRARFDPAAPQGSPQSYAASASSAGSTPGQSNASSMKARMHGHPGGQARQRYLALLREWAGRGTTIDDPYDPDLVRRAPREIRHYLAKALAEEATAHLVSGLGIGFTAWHDVDPGRGGDKLDHVVLGPAGLFGILSEDWGGPVELRRGELVGETLNGEEPLANLQASAKSLTKTVRVRFTALLVVLPDSDLVDPLSVPARGRRPTILAVPRSRLPGLLRSGLPDMERGSFEKVFELRGRLQEGIRFVAE